MHRKAKFGFSNQFKLSHRVRRSFDFNAKNYIDAAGITDSQIKCAANNLFKDLKGIGNTTNNSVIWNPNIYFNVDKPALRFNGSDQFGTIESSITLDGDFIISFWFKSNLTTYDTTVEGVFGNSANLTDLLWYNNVIMRIGNSTSNVDFATTSYDGQWHHCMITRSGSDVSGYIDGAFISTGTNAGTYTFDQVGRLSTTIFNNGSVDEMVIVKGSSGTLANAQDLYNSGNGKKSDTVLTPTHYWDFSEGSGGTLTDSASGNDITLANSPTWVYHNQTGISAMYSMVAGQGYFKPENPALNFASASTEHADFNSAVTIECGNAATVSFWFRTSTFNGMVLGNNTTSNDYIYIVNSTTVRLNDVDASYNFTVAAMDSGWHHCMISADLGSVRCYVDGVESTTGALSTSNPIEFDRISGRVGDGFLWNGDLDEIAISTTYAGTAQDAADIYNSGLGKSANQISPSVYWKMNEGSGTTTADSVGSNTLTLVNTPSWITHTGANLDYTAVNAVNPGTYDITLTNFVSGDLNEFGLGDAANASKYGVTGLTAGGITPGNNSMTAYIQTASGGAADDLIGLGSSPFFYVLRDTGAGDVQSFLGAGGTPLEFGSDSGIMTGTRQAVSGANAVNAYLNGVLVDTDTTVETTPASSEAPLELFRLSGTNYYQGRTGFISFGENLTANQAQDYSDAIAKWRASVQTGVCITDIDTAYIILDMGSNGASVSAEQARNMQQLVLDLKGEGRTGTANTWTKLDALQIYAAENQEQSLTKWLGNTDPTNTGTFVFQDSNPKLGAKTNASFSINSNFFPATEGVNFTLNDGSIGGFGRNTNDAYFLGIDGGSPNYLYIRIDDDGAIDLGMNSALVSGQSFSSNNALFSLQRSSSAGYDVYTDETNDGTRSDVSTAIPTTYDILVGGLNRAAPLRQTIDAVKLFYAGASFDSDEVLQLTKSFYFYLARLQTGLTITDLDVAKYIVKGDITSATEAQAIIDLVAGMKAGTIWGKAKTVHPISPTSLSAAALDLKGYDDITWVNSPTHSAAGVSFDNTGTQYGQLSIDANVTFPNATYNHGNTLDIPNGILNTGAKYATGALSAGTAFFMTLRRDTNTLAFDMINSGVLTNGDNTGGIYTINRTAIDSAKLFRDGVELVEETTTVTITNIPSEPLAIGAATITGGGPATSPAQMDLRFWCTHEGLTDDEVLELKNLINAYNTAVR